jgi:hypothetical protein
MKNLFVLHVTNGMSDKSETTQKTDHKVDVHSFIKLEGFDQYESCWNPGREDFHGLFLHHASHQ